jgi:ribosomal protein S18 acetylase RimI-like enzyme
MPSQPVISDLTEKDLDALRTISIQTFTETFREHNTEEDMRKYVSENLNPEKLLKELNTNGSRFYFIHSGEELAGYMKLNEGSAQTVEGKTGTLEIERIYVLEKFQGQQFGKILFQHAVALAQEARQNTIWLGVWERNTKAIAFYERNGFVKTGSHDFVLGDDVQTDHIMELHLNGLKHAH